MDIFNGFSSINRETIEHYDDSLLIMADDDYGKNKVLTNQVTTLLANGIAPENILVITSTNRDIVEMRDSVAGQEYSSNNFVISWWMSMRLSTCSSIS